MQSVTRSGGIMGHTRFVLFFLGVQIGQRFPVNRMKITNAVGIQRRSVGIGAEFLDETGTEGIEPCGLGAIVGIHLLSLEMVAYRTVVGLLYEEDDFCTKEETEECTGQQAQEGHD